MGNFRKTHKVPSRCNIDSFAQITRDTTQFVANKSDIDRLQYPPVNAINQNQVATKAGISAVQQNLIDAICSYQPEQAATTLNAASIDGTVLSLNNCDSSAQ
jgi:hypothetical protein